MLAVKGGLPIHHFFSFPAHNTQHCHPHLHLGSSGKIPILLRYICKLILS